jgi:hypothetical protein
MTRPIGAVRVADASVTVEYTVDAGAHISLDLLAQPVKLEGVAFTDTEHRMTTLMSVVVDDNDGQSQNLTVVFHNADVGEVGTLNAAPSLAPAQLASGQGFAQVTTWEDLGVVHQGCEKAVGLTMEADANGNLWAWLLSKGTGTYAGGKLRVKFAFLRH